MYSLLLNLYLGLPNDMKYTKFEAFIKFEELGFDDYIIHTKLNIKGKIFPNSRKTAGDLLNLDLPTKDNSNDFKVYKNISVLCDKNLNEHYSENLTDLFSKEIITETKSYETKIIKEKENVFDAEELASKITNKVLDNLKIKEKNENINEEIETSELKENFIQNENIIYNQSVENFNSNPTNFEENNITNILQNQINQSNAYTIEQIEMLEKNINVLNKNVYVNITQLENSEKKLIAATEEIKREIKNDIKETKDYFQKFLNS